MSAAQLAQQFCGHVAGRSAAGRSPRAGRSTPTRSAPTMGSRRTAGWPTGAGRTGFRLGWRNPAGCGPMLRATAPRDPGQRITIGRRSARLPAPEGAGQGVLAAGPAQHRQALFRGPRHPGLLRLLRPGAVRLWRNCLRALAGTGRWTIEECHFDQEAKGEVGLDQYEVLEMGPSPVWYWHITLAMLASTPAWRWSGVQASEQGGPGEKSRNSWRPSLDESSLRYP